MRSNAPETQTDAPPPAPGPINYSLNHVPDRERGTHCREFFESLGVRYEIERVPDVPFVVDVSLQGLPNLLMMKGAVHGSCNRQTRETISSDDFGLLVNLKGPFHVSQGQDELVLDDGEATFVSMSDPCGFTHRPPGHILALRFPRAQLAPLVSSAEDCLLRRIPSDSQALRLLRSYVDIAWDQRTMASPELQHLASAHMYDLTAYALGATRDAAEVAQGRGMRAARLRALKEDIGKNIDRPDLSLTTLATRHGLAPRVVQRLFESEGTSFTDYVLAQRLARAHRLLSDPRFAGEKIATVAYDVGFGDLSYFNRVFRRRYGAAPSEVRLNARRLDS